MFEGFRNFFKGDRSAEDGRQEETDKKGKETQAEKDAEERRRYQVEKLRVVNSFLPSLQVVVKPEELDEVLREANLSAEETGHMYEAVSSRSLTTNMPYSNIPSYLDGIRNKIISAYEKVMADKEKKKGYKVKIVNNVLEKYGLNLGIEPEFAELIIQEAKITPRGFNIMEEFYHRPERFETEQYKDAKSFLDGLAKLIGEVVRRKDLMTMK